MTGDTPEEWDEYYEKKVEDWKKSGEVLVTGHRVVGVDLAQGSSRSSVLVYEEDEG